MKTLFAKTLLTAATLSIAATGAFAQERIVRTVAVPYGDLDLTSTEGQMTLNGRLKGAVRQVCGSADQRVIAERNDLQNCRESASTSAKRASVTLIAAAAAGTLTGSKIMVGS